MPNWPRWLAWLLDALAPQSRPTPAPAPPSSPTVAEVIDAINAERAKYGRSPLAHDPDLTRIAQAWATNMARVDQLTHGGFAARIATVHPRTAAGENIAEGYSTAAAVVAGWMNSPGHRANILGNFSHVGVGADVSKNWHTYWTADFCLLTTASSP